MTRLGQPGGGSGAQIVDPLADFDTFALALGSCQSYYKFQEPLTNSLIANLIRDSKGAVHGTIVSTLAKVFTGTGRGLRYGGISFAGAGSGPTDYVSIGDVYDFAANATFSLLALLRPNALASGVARSIGGKGTGTAGGDQYYWTLSTTGKPGIYRFDAADAEDHATGLTSVLPGEERLLIASYDGANLRMSVDGVTEATTVSGRLVPNAATDNRIGNIVFNGQGFPGEIVRYGIFNAAILQADITELQSRRA